MSIVERYPTFFLGLILMLLTISGCGGGGGGSGAAAPGGGAGADSGEVMVSITDAPGDFVAYSVDVTSVTLTRTNGDVIETLPNTTRIDFNELTEVTEFLSIATVPAGNYDAATITLDFSNAEILVQNDAGDAVAARVEDADGAPIGLLPMTLTLTGSDIIRVQPGIPAAFSLDFDLDASNSIDLGVTPPVVTVEPFLLATAELETDREHRARGLLDDVALDDNEFDLRIRPFHHRSGRFGTLTVGVDDATEYDVDGQGYTGAAGLEALAALNANAPVVALGEVNNRSFAAAVVVAGSSVPWDDADVIQGVVVARQDDTLTVRSTFAHLSDGTRRFRGTYRVQLTPDTGVSAPGATTLTPADLSVGQPILAWGETVDDNTLSASRVRMRYAQLTATVVESAPLVADLIWFNGRRPAIYDFSGTGTVPDTDADPAAYQIDTATLALTTVEQGDLIRVRGLVNTFGMAPADFNARTVIDVQTDERAAHLWVAWSQGSTNPFISTAPERVEVDLEAARAALKLRGVPLGVIDLMSQVALISPASDRGVYAVQRRGSREIRMFRSFAALVDALVAELDAGHALHRINAQGRYNAGQAELTTGRAGFVFATRQATE